MILSSENDALLDQVFGGERPVYERPHPRAFMLTGEAMNRVLDAARDQGAQAFRDRLAIGASVSAIADYLAEFNMDAKAWLPAWMNDHLQSQPSQSVRE